jgi:hypothetical protein
MSVRRPRALDLALYRAWVCTMCALTAERVALELSEAIPSEESALSRVVNVKV